MVTISPHYTQKNVPNPFYTVVKAVVDKVSKFTKIKDPLYKNVDNGDGKLILDTRGKFIFQIYNRKNPTKYFITIRSADITGHLGMKSRKDTTASSNVNEILSVFFLINKYAVKNYLEKVQSDASKFKDKSTGVLNPDKNGSITKVSYKELAELLDKAI